MTTIAEDLKTMIDTDYSDGVNTVTTIVFMKTDSDATPLEPPTPPTAAKATIIIFEGNGIPIRYTEGSDIIVYEGELVVYTITYATMILVIAELKQIADVLTTGTGELIFNVPKIEGDVRNDTFEASIKYRWERLEARG